ncbi:MAG: serine hydrolase domain-containing protein [Alphaproteobacteria bacterium]
MFKTILQKLFSSASEEIETRSTYKKPEFIDKNRLKKVQTLFPKIDRLYENYAKKYHVVGHSYAILLDGKLVHTHCGGYANLEQKTSVTSQTVFRVASITKSFTAMAILQLKEQGKLNMDDPVHLYLPEIKGQKLTQDAAEITIRDLMVHGAGFPEDNAWGDRKLHITSDELIAMIKQGINFSTVTGAAYEYSNLGYGILGYIIGKISGMSCQDYIAKTIFRPLDMQQAAWEYTNVPSENLAHGYKWADGNWQEEGLLHDGAFASMGGMLASIEDLSKYVGFHQNAWPARDDGDQGPVSRGTVRSMHEPRIIGDFSGKYKFLEGDALEFVSGYGYGLFWGKDTEGRVYVYHSGGLPGFGCNWLMLPHQGLAVAFLGNSTYVPAFDMNMQALHMIIKQAKLEPRMLPVSSVLLERQKQLLDLLPDWDGAVTSGVFASNFFLDNNLEDLRKKTQELFAKIGKITDEGEIVPQNQLRGYFVVKGRKGSLKINFTLAPDRGALIQSFSVDVQR